LLLGTDETDCTRLVDGHTLNYNHRKPYIPLPPALPRFSLPNEGVTSGGPNGSEDDVDPLDAAATSQRPAVSMRTRGSRRVVRKKVGADSTEEVQVEDILLEAYAEDPPPPPSRRMPPLPVPARVSIAAAIASVVPPPPAQSAAVDALLRASDPAFAPFLLHVQGADYETPSVSPMMLATMAPPARPVIPARGANRALVVAVWTALLLVVSAAAAGAVVLGVRDGTYARLRDSAKSAAARAGSKHDAPVAASPAPAPSPSPAPSPIAPAAPAPAVLAEPAVAAAPARAAPAAVPTMSVDALPKSPIPADSSLVTLPAYAQGHRVFVDGRVIAVADGSPTKIKCGRHMIKIGSARKPRVIDLACGREVVIQ
jgi:hypothetical protein